jgi:hypothetical protein
MMQRSGTGPAIFSSGVAGRQGLKQLASQAFVFLRERPASQRQRQKSAAQDSLWGGGTSLTASGRVCSLGTRQALLCCAGRGRNKNAACNVKCPASGIQDALG